MLANYHTHTPRCHHAQGDEREYIEVALAQGMRELGFSDHAPYPFPPQHVSGFRMDMGQTGEYFMRLRTLRHLFAGRITLHIGFEAEYYPAYFAPFLANVRRFGCEYLLLGQHFLDNELTQRYSGAATADEARLAAYVQQVVEGMATGAFSCVAHPDLVDWRGGDAAYARQMRRLCREARRMDIPLEINLLGLREGRCYPRERFWQLAGEEGCAAVLGVDAHQSAALALPGPETAARAMAGRCGVRLLERLPLRRP